MDHHIQSNLSIATTCFQPVEASYGRWTVIQCDYLGVKGSGQAGEVITLLRSVTQRFYHSDTLSRSWHICQPLARRNQNQRGGWKWRGGGRAQPSKAEVKSMAMFTVFQPSQYKMFMLHWQTLHNT